ncbi:MAG: hypothetical protein IKP67_08820 [Spirochaetales bacterium]|nr:hypothetical protein [Spirochaetales bacterium]
MPMRTTSKILSVGLIILGLSLLCGCKSTGSTFADLLEKQKNFDKYSDSYSGVLYNNDELDFSIEFDANWKIHTQFADFTEQQKKFAEYFSTERSEVLFIGLNDKMKMGVRCMAEVLSMPLDEYAKTVRKQNTDTKNKYKITFSTDKSVTFDNFEAVSFVYEAEVNPLNIFVFDAILFKNFANDYRLEFWTKKDNYDAVKDIMQNIYKSITFERTDIESDQTDDTAVTQ